MAFRMKHWIGAVAVSLAVIALWGLPLDSVTPGRARTPSFEEARYRDLDKELRDTRALLDQTRRADALPGTAVAAARDRVGVVVPEHTELTAGTTARLSARIRAEARALDPRDPELVVAYAYDGGSGSETGLAVSQGFRPETYLGEWQGTPYCLQVVVTRPVVLAHVIEEDLGGRGWSYRTGNLLGPCAVYAEHGLPGPRIQEWLEAGGIDFAFGRRDSRVVPYSTVRRRSFMPINALVFDGSTLTERCLTGDAESCATIVLRPDLADSRGAEQRRLTRSSPAFVTGLPMSVLFGWYESWFLLSDLEREFGRDAFARFWTSDGDVRTAFEAAFGEDLGDWVVRWVDAGPGIERASPAPTLSATLGSLLLVSLVTGASVLQQRRRRVA